MIRADNGCDSAPEKGGSVDDIDRVAQAQDVFAKAAIVAADLLRRHRDSTDSADGEVSLGLAAYEMRLYQLATRHLRAARELRSTPELSARVALAEWREGNLAEAEDAILRALQEAPDDTLTTLITQELVSFRAIYAKILLEGGRIEECIEVARTALDRFPEDGVALHALADAELLMGDTDAAIEHLEMAHNTSTGFAKLEFRESIDIAKRLREANISVTPFVRGRMIRAIWPD
jgi:tetratricopeptide (TPR) repeat protein